MPDSGTTLGCVVIGRNEGVRLRLCLESLPAVGCPIVYVDSGSTDGSQEVARARGCTVVELDPSRPFTAARGRNEGMNRLRELFPGLLWVQFVDGDSTLEPGWIEAGRAYLEQHPDLAVVFGPQRERHAERSRYHRLLQVELMVEPGRRRACGGTAMYRVAAFAAAGGFREDMAAGEEPELCVRIRQAGFAVECLPVPMAVHDVGELSFGRWWRRAKRGGTGYAASRALHGGPQERHGVSETRRALFWAIGLPLAVLAGLPFVGAWSLLLLFAYPVSIWRSFRFARSRGLGLVDSVAAGCLLTLGKFAEAAGVVTYRIRTLLDSS